MTGSLNIYFSINRAPIVGYLLNALHKAAFGKPDLSPKLSEWKNEESLQQSNKTV